MFDRCALFFIRKCVNHVTNLKSYVTHAELKDFTFAV